MCQQPRQVMAQAGRSSNDDADHSVFVDGSGHAARPRAGAVLQPMEHTGFRCIGQKFPDSPGLDTMLVASDDDISDWLRVSAPKG